MFSSHSPKSTALPAGTKAALRVGSPTWSKSRGLSRRTVGPEPRIVSSIFFKNFLPRSQLWNPLASGLIVPRHDTKTDRCCIVSDRFSGYAIADMDVGSCSWCRSSTASTAAAGIPWTVHSQYCHSSFEPSLSYQSKSVQGQSESLGSGLCDPP